MDPFYREFELTKPVSDFFVGRGFKVFREVKIGYCRADLVAFKDNTATAIELKLNDRKKAIIQAKNYQLASDYVYLAFPLMKSYSILRKSEHILKKEGIGLLTVNEETGKVSKIINPQLSKRKFTSITIQEIKKRRNYRIDKFNIY